MHNIEKKKRRAETVENSQTLLIKPPFASIMFSKELMDHEKLAAMKGCLNNDGYKQPNQWKQYYVYPITERGLEETSKRVVDQTSYRYPAKLFDSDSEFDQ
jgi:hypothetical protein